MGRHISLLIPLLTVATSVVVVAADWLGETKQVDGVTYQCKCYSDNACYPTAANWMALNVTVGGALKRAVPPAAVCHDRVGNLTTYDEGACREYKAHFNDEQFL
jgi:hypothetical protein